MAGSIGLFLVVPIVILVVIFVKLSRLKKRVNYLEGRLIEGVVPQKPAVQAVKVKTTAQTVSPKIAPIIDSELGTFHKFGTWLKTDWLMKLGAFFLILALAWFVTLSFMENWIGPLGRVTLGILVGAVLLFWGHTLIAKKSVPGQVIVVTGATMILLTVFAARDLYDFFTPASALGIMALTVVLTAVIAIVHRTQALAVMALIGGAVAPLLTATPSPDFVALLSYIFILDLGVLAVVSLRGWRSLIFLGLLITGGFSSAFFEMDQSTVWIFMALFFALFFAASTSAIWRNKKALVIDLITTVLAVALGITWVAEFIPEHLQSIVLAGSALAAIVLSSLLFRRGAPSIAVYTHGAAAMALLGAATAFELEGEALTIAFFIEAFALLAVARFGMKDTRAIWGASFLQIIPLVLALESFDRWRDFGDEFAVVTVGVITLFASAFILRDFFPAEKNWLVKILSALGALFSVVLIWRLLELVIDSRSYAHGAALVVYTLLGIVLFFRGTSREIKAERVAGIIMLSLVALRLLFVEVWDMSLGGRIITFMLVGALFISTAFFKKSNQSEDA